MTNRRYRGARSYPIPVWNGILDHRAKIDEAIWVFLWCLDKVTREEAGVGFVLGGSAVTADKIAADLACSEHTVRDHLKVLVGGGYVELKRAPHGFVITVCNSAKFGVWRSSNGADSDRQKSADHSCQRSSEIPGVIVRNLTM